MLTDLEAPLRDHLSADVFGSRYEFSGEVGDWVTTICLKFRDRVDRLFNSLRPGDWQLAIIQEMPFSFAQDDTASKARFSLTLEVL